MKYRAEIDGLRALAVFPVILFHAGFELFNGGFVGVDVFFVISGYLITTILIEDIENNRFSIVNFYERRARRILPALVFVMLVCIPFAWMWMLPSQMKDFSQSFIAVSLFASNILFWKESGYFDAVSEEKPLLHTWSLAVEEQYYVLFPIFIILAWRFGKRRVFWMIVLMSAVSLLLSEWGWRNKASANFYLAPTRAWELFAGSISAFIVQKQGVKKNNLLALIGLTAIIFSIFVYDEITPFPSLYALVPVTGVVLIVLYADKETLVAKLLGTRVLVGIGLISYSAYLWHQPLFAFARIKLIEKPSMELMLILSIASIALAYGSWKYIEKPFRSKLITSKKLIFSTSFLMLFTPFSIGLYGYLNNGFSTRYSEEIVFLDGFKVAQQQTREESCAKINGFNKYERCVLGNKENIKGVLFGDSHAQILWEPLNLELKKLGVGILSFSGGGCPPIFWVWRRDTVNNCHEYNTAVLNYIKSNSNLEYIILSGRWTVHVERHRFNNREGGIEDGNDIILDIINNGTLEINTELTRKEKLLKKIRASIELIDSLNRNMFVVYPVPEVGFIPAEKVIHQLLYENKKDYFPTHSYDVFLDRNKRVRETFRDMRENKISAKFFDVSDNLCSKVTRRCKTFNENRMPLYFDNDHLSSFGAKLIAEEILEWMNHINLK